MKPRGDYINGKFVRRRRGDGELRPVDPCDTETALEVFSTYSEAGVEAAAAARAAAPRWEASAPDLRIAALRRLHAQLHNRAEDLALRLALETGRPLWECRGELRSMHDELDGLLLHGLGWLTAPMLPLRDAQVVHRPLGVVLVLSPYPEPALLMHVDAVAAIAAGCTVVCKPSPRTPGTAQLYAELVDEADLPRGVFNLVQGDDACGAALATGGLFDGILFAGAERTARTLEQLASSTQGPRLRTLTTGLCAALVLDDANLDQAAYQIAIGACLSAGQRCTTTHRVIVDRRVAEPLIARLVPLLRRLVIGHSSDRGAFMGPLIAADVCAAHAAEVNRLTASAADVLLRGKPLVGERRGSYVTPTLLEHTPAAMIAACDRELVGPLVLLSRVDDLDQGLELANSVPYGLSLALFCQHPGRLDAVLRAQRCALVVHNGATTRRPIHASLLPQKRSGNGHPWGLSTARWCARPTVRMSLDSAVDFTALPPGLPPEPG